MTGFSKINPLDGVTVESTFRPRPQRSYRVRWSGGIFCVAALFFIGAGLLSNGCICSFYPRVWRVETQDLVLPADGLKGLAVVTGNGRIGARGSSAAREIQVHITKRAGASSRAGAVACLNAIVIDTAVENGVQKIGWHWEGSKLNGWTEEVSFDIGLPDGLASEVETNNGEIVIFSMNADARAKTNNGRIIADQTRGKVWAETSNGAIDIRGHQGEVIAKTNNGAIDVNAATPRIHLVTNNGHIGARLAQAGPVEGSATTQNGAIDLDFGNSASTELTCQASNGAIQTGNSVRVIESDKHRVVGRIGEGSGKFQAETTNGAITVK